MKKLFLIFCVAGVFAACNNSAEKADDKMDSLEQRKDTLIENVDSATSAKIDSLKNRSEALKDHFDSSIEAKKDSIKQ